MSKYTSESDDEVPDLVEVNELNDNIYSTIESDNKKVPVTIITGYLGILYYIKNVLCKT